MKARFDRVLSDAFVIALASMVASVAIAATPTSIAPVFVNGIRNYENPTRTDVILEDDETGFLNFDNDPFESRTALEFPSSEIPSDADTFQLRAYFEAGALPKSVEIYAYSGDGTLSLTDFDPGATRRIDYCEQLRAVHSFAEPRCDPGYSHNVEFCGVHVSRCGGAGPSWLREYFLYGFRDLA